MASKLAADTPARAAQVIGTYYSGAGLGILLTGLALPPLVTLDAARWPLAWLALGAASLLAMGVTGWAAGQVGGGDAGQNRRPEAWSWRPLLFGSLAYFLFALGYIAYMTFIIAYVRAEGATVGFVMVFWTVLGLAAMLGARAWGKTINESQGGRAMALVLLTVAAGSALPLMSSHPLVFLVSAALFGGSFLSVVTSITELVRRFLPASAWPGGLAFVTVVFAVGQSLGPVFAGALSDRAGGLEVGLGLSAGFLLLGAAAAWMQRPKR